MKITQNKNSVRKALIKYPKTRDSYYMLIAHIWWDELADDLKKSEAAKKIFNKIANGNFSHPESLMRCRRLLQEKEESLRGETYKHRVDSEEKSVRTEIIQEKFSL